MTRPGYPIDPALEPDDLAPEDRITEDMEAQALGYPDAFSMHQDLDNSRDHRRPALPDGSRATASCYPCGDGGAAQHGEIMCRGCAKDDRSGRG